METLRILVTGCSGFLGHHVAEYLTERGHDVTGLDQVEPRSTRVRFLKMDFTSKERLEPVLRGMDSVCHLGGVGDIYLAEKNPELAFRVNAYGTMVVKGACQAARVRSLVYASTWEVYGKPISQPIDESHPCNPETPYSISKFAGELCAGAHEPQGELRVFALRLGTAYGAFMRDTAVISRFIQCGMLGDPITVQGRGTQFRQFTHARDISRGFFLAATRPELSGIYNMVAPDPITVLSLAELVSQRYAVPITFQSARRGDPPSVHVSAAKAKAELRWEPEIKFEVGLRELFEHYPRSSRRQAGLS